MAQNKNILLIAPCGINCNFCFAHLREKNKCTGCRGCDDKKPITRTSCKIKNCQHFQKDKITFCFECSDFPCKLFSHIDKRYRTKYNLSLIGNLVQIKEYGIKEFIKKENLKWKCLSCGGAICIHSKHCVTCGN